MSEDTDELRELARRTIWWEPPEESLRYPRRLLCYVMARGTWDDWVMAHRAVGDAGFRDALEHPSPGVFDVRSWRYWHVRLGVEPEPPLPRRVLP